MDEFIYGSTWFWDCVTIVQPCLSWEMCFDCGNSIEAIWPTGKYPGRFTNCPTCGMAQYTIGVHATAN